MNLGYKFYRNNLIKVAILSVGCLGIFWDEFTGQGNPNNEPAALVLIALLIVFGNLGLFIAMRRAKKREAAETNALAPAEGQRIGIVTASAKTLQIPARFDLDPMALP